ncbi:MAG TPA: PA2779 family protein [Ideonella sp.]|jgi:hypothetical protein|nr:PA2779 family protein [Ideonella sp.]
MKVAMRVFSWVLAGSLSFAGMMQTAQAGVIGAEQAVAAEQATGARDTVMRHFERADVQAALQARGVDLVQAHARVAALTDAEAQMLADQIDAAPAGADSILGVLVFIFVLLLITDILGLTKVFPFTRSVR